MKNLVIRFSILVFILLLVVSGIWLFLLRTILVQLGVPESNILLTLFIIGRFVFVLIIALSIIAFLVGFIFIEKFKINLLSLIKQLKGFTFGSRILINSRDELADLNEELNKVLAGLEKEISSDLLRITEEEKLFKNEQNLLAAEQKKIYDEQEKLEYVMSRITDGVILLTRNRNVVLFNKASEELTGFAQSDVQNRQLSQFIKFHDDTHEILIDEYAPVVQTRALRDEAFLKKGVRLESARTTPKLVDLICVKLTLIHTQDLGYMLVLHDLTEQIEAEKKKTGLLSSFASALNHPINLISKQNTLNSGVAHLSLLMENLLTVKAIEDRTIVVAAVSVDLVEIVNNCIALVQPIAFDRQISLSFNSQNNQNILVLGDQSRLSQVILNLLMNAVYFTPPGGNIVVSISQADEDIILQIQDSGIGIPTEAMKDLFTKFFVVPNDKGLETGTGLGLYISRELIELQKGKIWLDSVVGRGTVASISLQKAV